ncbi:uncharacterized protein EAF01_007470 [Botrytis porri]|uniref:uncharacterized protein n=1 Tax=Botrytis porri TaxID=87229 RepID=UPI00190285A1|nr:uncharacterized protein EAF01_007470 [Botrytis porri]KAF7902172.1 hypothetical protein EAF01_007470 [Botrytis porri]
MTSCDPRYDMFNTDLETGHGRPSYFRTVNSHGDGVHVFFQMIQAGIILLTRRYGFAQSSAVVSSYPPSYTSTWQVVFVGLSSFLFDIALSAFGIPHVTFKYLSNNNVLFRHDQHKPKFYIHTMSSVIPQTTMPNNLNCTVSRPCPTPLYSLGLCPE